MIPPPIYSFGHLTGNRALNRLARVMKEHCRGTEIAARYGGDKFAILLLDANGERAQNVDERISSCLRLQADSPALSVSIGFAIYPADGLSAPELLEAADKRLYQSKKSRNSGELKPDRQHFESARAYLHANSSRTRAFPRGCKLLLLCRSLFD